MEGTNAANAYGNNHTEVGREALLRITKAGRPTTVPKLLVLAAYETVRFDHMLETAKFWATVYPEHINEKLDSIVNVQLNDRKAELFEESKKQQLVTERAGIITCPKTKMVIGSLAVSRNS